MSNCITILFFNVFGTFPEAMRSAKPCATAVFPTPGSPKSTGLFFERRPKMRIVLSNSPSRPIKGSNFPSRAMAVRSWLNARVTLSSGSASTTLCLAAAAAAVAAATLPPPLPVAMGVPLPSSASSTFVRAASADSHDNKAQSSCMATPVSRSKMARNMCDVSTVGLFCSLEKSRERSKTHLPSSSKGISNILLGSLAGIRPSSAARTAGSSMPKRCKA
mmetsp:Transcript_154266/g.494693  ORF Transcript_154266/g.494693 Transcript_154266/m.494693 type:complete len:219 (+) Transcript_154266:1579-2235(+)